MDEKIKLNNFIVNLSDLDPDKIIEFYEKVNAKFTGKWADGQDFTDSYESLKLFHEARKYEPTKLKNFGADPNYRIWICYDVEEKKYENYEQFTAESFISFLYRKNDSRMKLLT